MPLYVLMTKLTPEVTRKLTERAKIGREWKKRVDDRCPEVKWIGHYALLGPYDFLDLYEAPDAEIAHRVSMISRAEGALTVESWPAIKYDRFLELMEQTL